MLLFIIPCDWEPFRKKIKFIHTDYFCPKGAWLGSLSVLKAFPNTHVIVLCVVYPQSQMADEYGKLDHPGKKVATLPPPEAEGYGKLDKVRHTCIVQCVCTCVCIKYIHSMCNVCCMYHVMRIR